MNIDEPRWHQRFEHFEKAWQRLDVACRQEQYNELEQAGLVQTFEFTFELAWKTLKDYLFVMGFSANSPRDTIKRAFEAKIVGEDDTETLLDAPDKRNLLAHTYDDATAQQMVQLIKDNYAPVLQRLDTTLKGKKEQ